MRITNIRHPEYLEHFHDYAKWRLTYKGGRLFLETYLKQFSTRETHDDFIARKAISHVPAYAKAGINKIKNTFYSRMSEIVRLDGPASYTKAMRGDEGGVDRFGSSMDVFLSDQVISELMTMKQVGIYVDRSPAYDPLLSNNIGNKPYLYVYKAEDILSWNFGYIGCGEYAFFNILLRDYNFDYDDKTGLAYGATTRYRHMWLAQDGKVHVQYYVPNTQEDATEDTKIGEEVILGISRIPLVVPGLKESLLADVADYQIGLLNISSADVNYVFKANFPFYTEQADALSDSLYTRRAPVAIPGSATSLTPGIDPAEGTAARAQQSSRADEVDMGVMRGRKYFKERPGFIAPPTEPLLASMQKQDQMKQEIFELLDIATANARPLHASAESKAMDQSGVESGLSYIGLELQWAENEVAKIWALYENDKPATVKYPSKYTLKSDAQRLDEAKALNEVKSSAPSRTFSKAVAKQITRVMLSEKVTNDTLEIIDKEIDAAEYTTSDPKTIEIASNLGMVDAVTGSDALGFDGKTVVPLAQAEHTKRLAEIAKAQSSPNPAARGVQDANPTPVGNPAAKDKLHPMNVDPSPIGRGTSN